MWQKLCWQICKFHMLETAEVGESCDIKEAVRYREKSIRCVQQCHSYSTDPLVFKQWSFADTPGQFEFLFPLRGSVFSKSWRLSSLQAGKSRAVCMAEHQALNQRLMPFRSSDVTTSNGCATIGSQLSRPLRKNICRIPLAFPMPAGLSIQMSAFSFHAVGFAKQKYGTVWNCLIKQDKFRRPVYGQPR